MKLRINLICRGQGTAYLSLKIYMSSGSMVDVNIKSEDGRSLPCSTYLLSEDNKASLDLAIATPLLDTKKIIIQVNEINKDDELISSKCKALSRKYIKWASRFYYRTDRAAALKLRDIDRVTFSDQIHINPSVCLDVPGQDLVIMKGLICFPINQDYVSLKLLKSNGEVDEINRPYLGNTAEVFHNGVRRTEMPFSIRISRNETTCLVASGNSDTRSGFLCFDGPSQNYFLSCFSPHMFRCSAPDRWRQISSARLREIECADRHDYAIPGPMFSVVVPLYHTPVEFFNEMVNSVLQQLYPRWELILINSTPDDSALAEAISKLSDDRITVITLESNLGISDNTNQGIEKALGDYIVFFDHDDLLDPMALYDYAQAINSNHKIDALYCDEDFLDENGHYISPHFKSDFNLDLLRCHNYITHLLAVRSSLAKELMLRSEFDGAQDYDFLLRLVERTQSIHHVREVLYHWRISDSSTAKSSDNKGYADEAGRKALEEHLERSGIEAKVTSSRSACFYHVDYSIAERGKVCIIIPNKDSVVVLKRCLDSLFEKTLYDNFEVLIVENNSCDEETFEYYRIAQECHRNLRVITWEEGFNYSKINNFAANNTNADYLLLLNNDTEVINPGWLTSMVSLCQRPEVGVVGAKLLYPDDTVQHAGVFMITCNNVNELGGPAHAFTHLDKDDGGYYNRAILTQDVSAVTGACLLTKKSTFDSLGGLDEDFVVAFNDVDYCLRARDRGELIVFDPDALLYHYESFSRGSDATGSNAERFVQEQGKLRARWSEYYLDGDPYFGRYATMN